MTTTKTLGMTSAINDSYPKENDVKRSLELETYLKDAGMYETDAELNHRYYLVCHIEAWRPPYVH